MRKIPVHTVEKIEEELFQKLKEVLGKEGEEIDEATIAHLNNLISKWKSNRTLQEFYIRNEVNIAKEYVREGFQNFSNALNTILKIVTQLDDKNLINDIEMIEIKSQLMSCYSILNGLNGILKTLIAHIKPE